MNRYALATLAAVVLVVLTIAGRIPCASATEMPPASDPIPTNVAAASAALGGLNLTTSFLNLEPGPSDLSPSWTRYVGVAGGLAGIMLGGSLLVEDKYEEAQTLGISSILVGTVATVAGIASIGKARKTSDTASVLSDPRHVSIAPAFHGGMAPGVGVRLRF